MAFGKTATAEPTHFKIIQEPTQTIRFFIKGLTPLLVHRKGPEVADEIINRQQKKERKSSGEAITEKENRKAKVPFEEFRRSLHIMPGMDGKVPTNKIDVGGCWPYLEGVFGFPVQGFKSALETLSEIKMLNIPKTVIKPLIRLRQWGLVPLKYKALEMHLAVLSVGFPPKADPRYRGMFLDWSTSFDIEFPTAKFSSESIVNAVHMAGKYMGLGEDRPQKGGALGEYKVDSVKMLEVK